MRSDCDVLYAAVIAFSELMAIDSGHHKWNLSLYDTGRYMRLDAAAQRALNVMKQRTDANDTFSLYGLMNKGRTPMAKRLLKVLSLTWPSACSSIPPFIGTGSSPCRLLRNLPAPFGMRQRPL